MAAGAPGLDEFLRTHSFLLVAAGVPPTLYHRLHRKISSETFDGGDFFSVEVVEGGRQRRLMLSSEATMESESDIFLIDHAWSFRLPQALTQLKEVPGLAERMGALMCVDLDLETNGEGKEESSESNIFQVIEKELERVKLTGDAAAWLEFEEFGIDDDMLCSLDLASKFPNLVALNLWGNKIEKVETVLREITKCSKLKAIWLNENPVLQKCCNEVTCLVLKELPGLEIFNSSFTSNPSEWALGFCGGIVGVDKPVDSLCSSDMLKNIITLDLSDRSMDDLPKVFSPSIMPSLSHLNLKGNELYHCSNDSLFKLLSGFSFLQTLEVDIPGPLGNSAVKIVESLPQISLLNGVDVSYIFESGKHVVDSMLQPRFAEWEANEPLVDRIVNALWLHAMTYRLADEEKIDETPVWYVMDELGSALRHSDEANFRVSPFLYMVDGKLDSSVSFTLMWPIRNVQSRDECTRDYLFCIGEDKQRSARLTAWFQTPEKFFIQEFEKYQQQLKGRQPPFSVCLPTNKSILPSVRYPLRVYTDIPQVEEFLTRPEFVVVNDPINADIIWTSTQVDAEVKKTVGLTDHQYVNQFPFEACLVMKHYLADTIQKAQGSPEWLQPTYNLEIQLPQLIGDYFSRRIDGRDNLWILKPWNMARTIDTTVTGNLCAIIRLMETGPKICQKYIEHPALFKGRKFDLRYIVLVRSMNPVDMFLSDAFWARLANNPYSLNRNSLFEYETHFTVMNYIGRLNHMNTPDFVREFEEEHQVKWLDIHERIRNMIRAVFDSAAAVHPEMHNSHSRALYGVDVMLDSSFMPKLLEVTYCPDCTRACKYDTEGLGSKGVIRGRDFFNTVFGCLFLDERTNVTPL